MQFNPAQKIFEVSIRIFTDDLEKCLSENNGNRKFTINNQDHNNPFIAQYLKKNFILKDAGKHEFNLVYLGKEQEDDATWVYFEIPFQGAVPGSFLQNSTLMDTYDDQVNMTNVSYLSEKKTFLFKKNQRVQTL